MKVSLINRTELPTEVIVEAMDITRGRANQDYTSVELARKVLALAKLGHWSVFEHASFTFLIEGVSRVTQQQLTRHRLASFSIESQRHVKADIDEAFVMPATVAELRMTSVWNAAIAAAYEAYDKMIDAGVPMEDARYILPEATTGDIIVTMNARELYHFFKLRMAPAAQWEIRELAEQMFNVLHDECPLIFNVDVLRYAE